MLTHHVNPALLTTDEAREWDAYLAEHCRLGPDDFGGDYCWDTDIPPREQWASQVWELNEYL